MSRNWTGGDRGIAQRVDAERRRRFRTTPQDKPLDPERWARDVGDVVLGVHGFFAGAWSCPCGESYTLDTYPRDDCRVCRLPYPRRCNTQGCGRICEPVEVTSGGVKSEGGTLPGDTYIAVLDRCAECTASKAYVSRANTYARSEVPANLRALAPSGYDRSERAAVAARVEAWLERDLGKSIGKCSLYFWGEPGRGKSMAAAWASHAAVVDRALVGDVAWTSQAALYQRHLERYQRDTDRARVTAERAVDLWRRYTEAPLLVVDDLGTSEPRGAFAESLSDLIRERLDHRRATLYTSNLAPQWSAWFPEDRGRIESRWSGAGEALLVGGPDWRAMSVDA